MFVVATYFHERFVKGEVFQCHCVYSLSMEFRRRPVSCYVFPYWSVVSTVGVSSRPAIALLVQRDQFPGEIIAVNVIIILLLFLLSRVVEDSRP